MKRRTFPLAALAAGLLLAPAAHAQEGAAITEDLLSGLKLRGIGPAARSGRVADVTIDPNDRATWYVAVASGNAFKTTNRGTTWEPIFENYPVYSTSTIVVDPSNSNVVWLGTGENNGQRSAGYGNGVWRSRDAGGSFEQMGLDESEHIGKIVLDPRDSDTVFVAAQGPLWRAGGDRGLYKTTDGGATWERVLHISEDTGISDVVLDPRNPDVVYASSWQRRRHTGLLVAGGPEGGIHKSEDGGATWKRLSRGPPLSGPPRHRPHRARSLSAEPGHRLRADRRFRRRERFLPFHGPRRELGKAQRLHLRGPAVLHGDLSGSASSGPHLLDGRLGADHRRRRKDLARPQQPLEARGQPRPGVRSRRPGLPHGEFRRRHLRDLGPWRALEVPRQPVPHAVLPGRDRQRLPLLQRLRRHPGQRHHGRPLAHHQRARHPQQRLAERHRRRRIPGAGGPRRSQHHLRPVPVRRDRPLRQTHRRTGGHPAATRARRSAAQMELGRAAHHLAPQRPAPLLRSEPPLPERRPREHLDPDQRRPHPGDQPGGTDGDGADLEHGRRVAERLHLHLRKHGGARRITARRGAALHRNGRRAHPDQR